MPEGVPPRRLMQPQPTLTGASTWASDGHGSSQGQTGHQGIQAQLVDMQTDIAALTNAVKVGGLCPLTFTTSACPAMRVHFQGNRKLPMPTVPMNCDVYERLQGMASSSGAIQGLKSRSQTRPATAPARRRHPVIRLKPPTEPIQRYPMDEATGRMIGDNRGFWKP